MYWEGVEQIVEDVNKYLGDKCRICRMCCDGTIFEHVEVDGKILDQPCPHLKGTGCDIYDRRPSHCKYFPVVPVMINSGCPEAENIKPVIDATLFKKQTNRFIRAWYLILRGY